MKSLFSFLLLCFTLTLNAQENLKVSTVEFVEVLNNDFGEAQFYYEKNWKELRNLAIKNGYIESFQLLNTKYSDETPYHFILITTYTNQDQYDKREDNFAKLMESANDLKLMNDKRPNEFRRTVMRLEDVKHME